MAPKNVIEQEVKRCIDARDDIIPSDLLLPPRLRTDPTKLTIEQIKGAALSTPARKIMPFDSFHPRHFEIIDDEGVRIPGSDLARHRTYGGASTPVGRVERAFADEEKRRPARRRDLLRNGVHLHAGKARHLQAV